LTQPELAERVAMRRFGIAKLERGDEAHLGNGPYPDRHAGQQTPAGDARFILDIQPVPVYAAR
jgi:hypothetical protein